MNRKNLLKRVSAWVLTLVMAISMFSIMALADSTWPAGWGDTITTGSLEVTKTDDSEAPLEGAEYVLYKVADINVTGGTLTYDKTTSVEVNTTTKASDFTDAILATLTPITGTTTGAGGLTGTDGKVTFASLPFGVYLVKETVTPDGVVTAHNFLVSIPMSVTESSGQQTWIKDVKATPKNSVFSGAISKDVAAASGHTIVTDPGASSDPTDDKLTVNIGTKLDYTIEVTMPTDFNLPTGGKKYTQFDIFDDSSNSLTVDTGSIKVYLGDATTGALLTAGTDYVLDITPSGDFTVKLVNSTTKLPYYAGLTAGDTVTVVYSATVNENATPGVAITNDAKINYNYEGSDGPGTEDPDPDDPEPELYTYSHAILKTGDDGYLNGAKFVVQNASNQYLTYNSTTKAWGTTTTKNDAYVFISGQAAPPLLATAYNGYIELIGLAYGNYTLTEIEAPAGYSLLDKAVSIVINAASTTTQVNSGHTTNAADYTTKIVNVAGFTLPGTGGSGIYIFIISGIVLIGAAILLYGKTRRKSSKA